MRTGIIVRPVKASDAEALYTIRQLVAEFQGNSDRSLEDTRSMFAEMEGREPGSQPGWHQFAIEESGEVIGDIGVNFDGPGPKQAEIGYSMHPDHWGRGAATGALAQILDELFSRKNVHRVVARTGADNLRSRALLERLGFRHEGTLVESWLESDTGQWSDEVDYALLDREWRRRTPTS